jgi:UDP-N-acetyl-2-amino-2-deoxyglucuronate dehydrogenase
MNNSSIVKFAVVGCGNIGKRHIAVLDNDPRAELVGICDIDENTCLHFSKLYNDVPYYTDINKLLLETDAEVICVCTPHGLHLEQSILIANAKKHILVEKPMALSKADSQKMIDAAKKNDVSLIVVKQNRFNKPIALTKQAIDENRLGKIYMVQCNVFWNRNVEYYTESNWRGKKELEGGVLYTQASHFLDLLIWWFGDVVSSKSIIENKMQPIEIEDCGSAVLKFETGVIGNLNWTTCVYNKNFEGSITIIGEKGTIKIGGAYLNKIEFWDIQSYPLPEGIVFDDKPNAYGKYQGTSSNHQSVIEQVVKKLLNERYDVVEGDEGIKSIEAIELIYQS